MYSKYLWLVLVFYQQQPAYPNHYVVRIVLPKSNNEGLGALVSDRHVVTAADLVSKEEDLELRFKNGRVDTVKFSNVHIHQEYQSGSVTDNIAFIHLPVPVDFAGADHSIRWPRSTDWPLTYDDYKVGITFIDTSEPEKPLKTEVSKIVKHTDCQKLYRYILTEGNLCLKLGKLKCGKNTGAIITYRKKGVERFLGFLTSYDKCNRNFQIATRAVEYMEWFLYNIVK